MDSILVFNFSTEFRQTFNSLLILKGTAVWFFREFMNVLVLAALKAHLTRRQLTQTGMGAASRSMPK